MHSRIHSSVQHTNAYQMKKEPLRVQHPHFQCIFPGSAGGSSQLDTSWIRIQTGIEVDIAVASSSDSLHRALAYYLLELSYNISTLFRHTLFHWQKTLHFTFLCYTDIDSIPNVEHTDRDTSVPDSVASPTFYFRHFMALVASRPPQIFHTGLM